MRYFYLDSSIILSFLLEEGGYFFKGGSLEGLFSSKLSEVEAYRAFDRLKITGKTDNAVHSNRLKEADWLFSSITLLEISTGVLDTAKQHWPVPVKALDAIHVSTAIHLRNRRKDTVFCTLDRQQGLAAQAVGFDMESEFKP